MINLLDLSDTRHEDSSSKTLAATYQATWHHC